MVDPVEAKPQYTSMNGCFLRVFWAMLGPALVLVSGFLIIANKSSYGSIPDFVVLGAAFASVGARYLDRGITDPDRDDGDIGKLHPLKYAIWMLIGASIVLVIAHSVARFF
jgi:drug/metabolite transporter (DMT)-like permease